MTGAAKPAVAARVLVITAVAAERDAVVRGVTAAQGPAAAQAPAHAPASAPARLPVSAPADASASVPADAPVSAPAPADASGQVRPADPPLPGYGPDRLVRTLCPVPGGREAPATDGAAAKPADGRTVDAGDAGVVRAGAADGRAARVVVDVLDTGVGPAAAAAATATALTAAAIRQAPYDLVVSAGIGGGFPACPPGSVVVAEAIVAADLGAETPEGFLPVTDLGFGTVEHRPPAALARAAAEATGAVRGAVLTVSTVTGSAARAAALRAAHPTAVAEAMEGFGVAEAAAAHGLPVLEVRTVSNAVGPRDRAAWRIGEAMEALRGAFRQLVPVLAAAARCDEHADRAASVPAGTTLKEEAETDG